MLDYDRRPLDAPKKVTRREDYCCLRQGTISQRFLSYHDRLPDYRKLSTHPWQMSYGTCTNIKIMLWKQIAWRVWNAVLLMTTDPGDLVLDPTCGSGTTAYVAEGWGRRWITIDTSRVAVALARQRLLTGSFDYYELKDESKGVVRRICQQNRPAHYPQKHRPTTPHSTLSSRHMNRFLKGKLETLNLRFRKQLHLRFGGNCAPNWQKSSGARVKKPSPMPTGGVGSFPQASLARVGGAV